MSIIFVFLVKDCEKQVSNCIFDTCFAFSQRRFSRCIARFSLWRRNGLHKPQNAFGVKAVRKAHFAAAARIFNRLQFVTVSFPSAQNTLASTASTDKNADSVLLSAFLSVRYSPTYKNLTAQNTDDQAQIRPRNGQVSKPTKKRQRFCCRLFVGA